MNRKVLSIGIASLVLISSTAVVLLYFTQNPDNSDTLSPQVVEWLEDFAALYDFIEGNYPYIWVKNRTHGYNWLDLRTTYEDRIRNAEEDVEFLGIILDAVQALQNRHTRILNPEEYAQRQIQTSEWSGPIRNIFNNETTNASDYWGPVYDLAAYRKWIESFRAEIVYEKGEYIIADTGSWTDQYGYNLKVIAVNGTPIDEAVKGVFEKSYIDWDYARNKSYLWRISPRDFGSNAEFTILNSTGFEANLTFGTFTGYSGSPYSYPSSVFSTEVWEAESTAYIHVSTFEWGIIQYWLTQILEFFEEVEDYDHLIIDIRGNTGGNYRSWIEALVEPLISEVTSLDAYLCYRTNESSDAWREWSGLTTEVSKDTFSNLPSEVLGEEFRIWEYKHSFTPDGSIDFSGDIILLIDNVVYSAAEAFTLFCKQTGFATIYGTTSGGDGLMEFPIFFCMPHSRLVLNMASALGLDDTGHSNEEYRTQPDVYYESDFGNFTELIDYVRNSLP